MDSQAPSSISLSPGNMTKLRTTVDALINREEAINTLGDTVSSLSRDMAAEELDSSSKRYKRLDTKSLRSGREPLIKVPFKLWSSVVHLIEHLVKPVGYDRGSLASLGSTLQDLFGIKDTEENQNIPNWHDNISAIF